MIKSAAKNLKPQLEESQKDSYYKREDAEKMVKMTKI